MLSILTRSDCGNIKISPGGTKDHRRGRKPPVMVQRQRKRRRCDRDRCTLKFNELHILSPLRGLSFVNALVPGAYTPVCVLSHLDFVDLWFGAYLADNNRKQRGSGETGVNAILLPLAPKRKQSFRNLSKGNSWAITW